MKEGWMKNDEGWMLKDEGFKLLMVLWLTDRHTDICECRVAFTNENKFCVSK